MLYEKINVKSNHFLFLTSLESPLNKGGSGGVWKYRWLQNNEEEIRADSSASDFIRSIWAYYLTLLTESKRHPGFLVMDEPC